MEEFTIHRGVAAPILHTNLDTDIIIPSREMKRVSKQGLGEGLFAVWRYTLPDSRELNPEFVLNQPVYANTSIILSGDNFGCGSSREHAVWALKEYGIRAIIAPSFGTIFYSNCIRNGILPIILADEIVKQLAEFVEPDPQRFQLTIDLPKQKVFTPDNQFFDFSLEEAHKDMLLKGLDGIALTLQLEDQINAFEQTDRQQRPWIYI